MNEAHIKKVISNALQLKEETISDIYRTSGGLTNKSYFATVNGEKMVIRIPGYGTEELVNRKEEKDNLIYATKLDRKSTRLNSSHVAISYAVFCLKKKIIREKNSIA